MVMAWGKSFYFTEFTVSKGLFYLLIVSYVVGCCCVCMAELFIDHTCEETDNIKYENPNYKGTPCRHTRYSFLLFLTPDECAYGRRLVIAVVFGGIIGWERRQADRPAGIRTMSLVALGSCLFTICSTYAFLDGPMAWDASRVSAAIPSGVGFLGAGLIFKEAEKDKKSGDTTHVVHGLTTAASLWLSAAVGVACGGELYFAASFSIALMLTLLRFGPRFQHGDDDQSLGGGDGDDNVGHYASITTSNSKDENVDPEQQRMLRKSDKQQSVRNRAHLGGIV
jgi:uncharacterized membrane protein YhiD involved in acid resistance